MKVMGQYLVSFDTDRIKDYIFSTDKLGEVRGASRLLDTLNQKLTWQEVQRICPSCENVFFAGGSGAVLAPSKDVAEELIQMVERLYRETTLSSSITGVAIPLHPAKDSNDFGARMEVASIRLRQAKDEKAFRTLPEVQPYTQPCTSCERYPARIVSHLDQRPICESCHAKREEENKRKREEERLQQQDPKAPRLADDLSELARHSSPPGYIGFIYADGNNMGDLLGEMEHTDQYKILSEKLNKLVKEAITSGFGHHSARGGIMPYEELLVGGDDLMLVSVADIALDAALDIADYFERESVTLLQEAGLTRDIPLTLGIGVVLAHAKFPMSELQRLANQLLTKAKQRSAEELYRTSGIDFMVVNAAGSNDVSTLRQEAYSEKTFVFPHADRRVNLTQRPYSVEEALDLLNLVRQFKQGAFPRRQLQYLYEGLFQSQMNAIYRWGRVAGRVKSEHRQLMDAFYDKFGDRFADDDAPSLPPWRKEEAEADFTCALGDLVEIYPFVPSHSSEMEDTNADDTH